MSNKTNIGSTLESFLEQGKDKVMHIKKRAILAIILTFAISIMFSVSADAKPKKKYSKLQNYAISQTYASYDNVYPAYQSNYDASSSHNHSLGGSRPAGCPRLWCGCWLSIQIFGTNIRELWVARNWLKFPKTGPSVGSVAVLSRGHGGHVGIVTGFDSNDNPIIKSGNHNRTVGVGVYSKRRVLAYVMPVQHK